MAHLWYDDYVAPLDDSKINNKQLEEILYDIKQIKESKKINGECCVCLKQTSDQPFLCKHFACYTCVIEWLEHSNKTECFTCKAEQRHSTTKLIKKTPVKKVRVTKLERKQFIKLGLTECKYCGVWIEKNGGCSTVQCIRCKNFIEIKFDWTKPQTYGDNYVFKFLLIIALAALFTSISIMAKNEIKCTRINQFANYENITVTYFNLQYEIYKDKRIFETSPRDYSTYKNLLDKFAELSRKESLLTQIENDHRDIINFNNELKWFTACVKNQESLRGCGSIACLFNF